MSSAKETDAPESIARPSNPGPLTGTGRSSCPYVGLPHDSETWMAFPSPANTCYYVSQPEEINIGHQQGFCLTENYPACAMLQMEKPKKLPAGIAGSQQPERHLLRRFILVAFILVLFAAIVTGVILLSFPDLRDSLLAGYILLPPTPSATAKPEAVGGRAGLGPLVIGPADTPTATTAVIAPSVTWTPAPTATATPTQLPSATPATTVIEAQPPSAAVVESTPTATATATPALPQIVVLVELLNVRSGNSVDTPVVAQLPEESRFDIVGRDTQGTWLLICCLEDGSEGWVFGESVRVEGDLASVPVIEFSPEP